MTLDEWLDKIPPGATVNNRRRLLQPNEVFVARDAWQARDAEIAALNAEVARLRVDAQRYRWLRAYLYRDSVEVGEATIEMRVTGCCPSPEDIDAAIDAQAGEQR